MLITHVISAPPGCNDECGVGSSSPSFTKPLTACENPYVQQEYHFSCTTEHNGTKTRFRK